MSKSESRADRKQIPFKLVKVDDETQGQSLARAALNPLLHSSLTVRDYSPFAEDDDINDLVDAFEDQVNKIADGNLRNLEEMLLAQAHTLHTISNHLFRRAVMTEFSSCLEMFLKLGLKAQNQSKLTCEALANIKAPKSYLTNIGHNQQINIGQSKLLEKSDGQRLDFGEAKTPITANQTVEAVGKQHRTKNGRG